MKRMVALNLILVVISSLCVLAADKPKPPGEWDQRVSLELKNVPLPEAIVALFKGTTISYSIGPGLQDARVTAKAANLPRDIALSQILAAAGATVKMENGTAVISAPSGGYGGGAKPAAGLPQASEVRVFNLKYTNAGDVIALIASDSQVRLIQSSKKSIVAKGSKEALSRLADIVSMLDTPSALLREIKIQLKVAITSTENGKSKPAGNFTTLSIGAEDCPQSLQIMVDSMPKPTEGKAGESPATHYEPGYRLQTRVDLIPTIVGEEGKETISIRGIGDISGYLQVTFNKRFDLAATVVPGQETIIAGGSADVSGDSMAFTISALATIEGRVKLPFAKEEESSDPIKAIKAQAALDEAKALYTKAKGDLEDARQRFKTGLCPEADVRAAETAFNIAEIHLKAAQQTYDAEQQRTGGFGGGSGGGATDLPGAGGGGGR